jgi:hypothetical protein
VAGFTLAVGLVSAIKFEFKMDFYKLKMFAILRKKSQKKSVGAANHNDLQFIDIEVDNWSINEP